MVPRSGSSLEGWSEVGGRRSWMFVASRLMAAVMALLLLERVGGEGVRS